MKENKIISHILILITLLSILFGCYAIYINEELKNEKLNLNETIENQNKLIKILEVSCECECDE